MQILNKREKGCLYLFQTKGMLTQKLSQRIRKNHMKKINLLRVYHIYTLSLKYLHVNTCRFLRNYEQN